MRAQVEADHLLSRILEHDPSVVSKVVSLCERAEYWGEPWQECSARVRYALSLYLAHLEPREPLGDRRAQGTPGRAPGAGNSTSPGQPRAVLARREVDRGFALLEGWLRRTGRSLADFLDLWEPPPDEP